LGQKLSQVGRAQSSFFSAPLVIHLTSIHLTRRLEAKGLKQSPETKD
jgi:hypothetical protein